MCPACLSLANPACVPHPPPALSPHLALAAPPSPTPCGPSLRPAGVNVARGGRGRRRRRRRSCRRFRRRCRRRHRHRLRPPLAALATASLPWPPIALCRTIRRRRQDRLRSRFRRPPNRRPWLPPPPPSSPPPPTPPLPPLPPLLGRRGPWGGSTRGGLGGCLGVWRESGGSLPSTGPLASVMLICHSSYFLFV